MIGLNEVFGVVLTLFILLSCIAIGILSISRARTQKKIETDIIVWDKTDTQDFLASSIAQSIEAGMPLNPHSVSALAQSVGVDKTLELVTTAMNSHEDTNHKQEQIKIQQLAELHYDVSSKLKRAKGMLNKAEQLGVDMHQLKDILAKAEQAYQKEDYTRTINFVKNYFALIDVAEKSKRQLEQMRENASEQIKSAKSSLKQAKWLGTTPQRAEELNTKAQSAFDTNDYSSAISYAQQSSDVTERLIKESKPLISIKLPPKMEYDTWKHQDITIINEGPVHAVAITITFLTALEVRGIKVIERLDAGDQKILNITVKPTDKGEVPVDYSVEFKDLMDRPHKTNSTKTIQIGTDIETARTIKSSVLSKSTTADTIRSKEDSRINTLSAFGYKGATIQYKVKVENPTPEPISDIKIHLFVPDVFLLEKNEKSISMLEPNESKTVTFEIRPTGECGDCNVSGSVNYYDYTTRKRQEIDLEIKSLSVVCPVLKIKDISTSEWRNLISNLVRTEETTKEISMPAETLFGMVSRVIEDMNMFMLEPEITATAQMFNGVVRFYGEGVKEFKYATQIEVVGGAKKSKLILKAWAEREDALTGFYHKILDELEKRVHVKEYIDDNIVQNYYHYGDKIGTQVKDSFVYKSNVGADDNVNCPRCGKEKTEGDPFCSGCGTKF